MEEIIAIAFPQLFIAVTYTRWKMPARVVLTLRPFTIRELFTLEANMAEPLALFTGRDARWLKHVHPTDIARLTNAMNELNNWKPQELAKQIDKKKKDGSSYDMIDLAAVLIKAGHNADTIWDYTPQQFIAYARRALALEDSGQYKGALLSQEATAVAIASAFGNKTVAEEFSKLLKEAIATVIAAGKGEAK